MEGAAAAGWKRSASVLKNFNDIHHNKPIGMYTWHKRKEEENKTKLTAREERNKT